MPTSNLPSTMSPRRIAYSTSKDPIAPAIHPIQRLPVDLLAEVFVHCLPESDETTYDWSFSTISCQKAPILLCKVCSSWRSLALHTPRLWQTFIFDQTEYNDTTRLQSLPNDIRAWLGRSGILPLTIRFRLYTNSVSLVTDSLKALFEFSSRWESTLIQRFPVVPWPFVGVLPNLRDFDSGSLQIDEFPFTSVPELKVLLLDILPLYPTSMTNIPWNQLQDLSILSPVPSSTILELLRGCPLLETLSIRIVYIFGVDSSLPVGMVSQIKHDALRYLILHIITPNSSAIFENITLPALELLELSGTLTEKRPSCYSYFFDLFTRSQCKLEALALTIPNFKPYQLLKFLRHRSCQTLRRLYVRGKDCAKNSYIPVVNDKVLSQLTFSYEPGTTPLCPKLVELTLKRCYRSSSSADSLGRMVCSRCFRRDPKERLNLLRLATLYPISTEDSEHLEIARNKRGLKLFYVCRSEKEANQKDTCDQSREGLDEERSEDGLDGDWDEGEAEEFNGNSLGDDLTDTD